MSTPDTSRRDTPGSSNEPPSVDESPSSNKPIRKQVGGEQEEDDQRSPAQQLWDLRQRMIDLGIDFGNDNERIRKVVGRSRDTVSR